MSTLFRSTFYSKGISISSVSFPFPRPKHNLVRRVLTPISSQTRTPAESLRRCCRRWRDKSSLSLLSSLSQADTRELTDRTVAIKLSSPLLKRFERSTPGWFPWLRYGVHVREERRAGNKRTQAQDARKGDEARVSTTPARTRGGSSSCGGVVRPSKKEKKRKPRERKKRRRTRQGCCVGAQRAIFTRGVGFCEFLSHGT